MPPGTFAKLIKVAQHGVESSIVGKESSLLSSAEVLIGQVKTKLPLVNHQLFQSVSFSSVSHLNNTLRHGTTFAVRLDSTNRKKNFSVVGAVSRTFSTPSVSGLGYQICGYHTDRLCAEQTRSLSSGNNMVTIAASGSKVFLSDGLVDNWITKRCYHAVIKNNVSTLCCAKGDDSHKFANMSFNNPDRPNNSCIYGYLVYSTIKSRYNLNFDSWSGWQKFHNFASTSFFAGAASDLLYSLTEDQATGSASLSDEKEALDRSLKLLSGSCYLPHPEKEATGGEDAHFICTEEHAIGVADGVGGWADLGVDAGLYARELMSNSVAAIREEPKGFIDPARVLEKAHSTTKADGSSTACIIALTNEGLHAINLGDSGFVVVREGRAVFQSPVQQHDFNFTYQLERGTNGDLPSSGEVFTVAVAPGDVVVAGTDGLFDNLYNNEITAVVVHALRAGFGPQVTAQKIAALARQRAQDTNRQTPFSTAAQDAGIRYYGGKLDDITVVVSYITSSSNITQRPNWLSKPGG